ncbi:MAG: multidrug ABC transporter ATP-binding protein [Maricaulis sp.]|uniref:ABC transporter ATP-binding protein n=1 Tax=Maricaulis virginensis TaxID=144022 RepID=UPI000C4E9044|nr:ABC transporter ATP-binding protein [Maricaulis virginensis]MAC39290.1 multidrug ABC transporter ATP-binding protein [Oceanicaulis sp.]MAZ90379.1 multidrug ABC transporter ATP-binding protein [Maricaulis sp.]
MLVADHLTKDFGPRRAVDDVSFTLERGEVLGFLGPNGAGKTTTMRMLAGALEADEGRASIAGHDCVAARLEAQARLGYLPEGAPAYPAMSPRDFVAFSLRARGFSGDSLKRAAALALERANLGGYERQPIGTLSKGYKRRAALAAAIAHDPPVLILDEPTDGLDPNQKDGVRQLIRDMAPDKAIIISTHILEEVPAVCSRAIVIARGRLLFDGSPRELAELAPERQIEAAFRQLTLAPDDDGNTPEAAA